MNYLMSTNPKLWIKEALIEFDGRVSDVIHNRFGISHDELKTDTGAMVYAPLRLGGWVSVVQ